MVTFWSETLSNVRDSRRADSDFFDPRAHVVSDALEHLGATPLAEWVLSARRGVSPEYEEAGEVRVVKTANVRRFELRATPAEYVSTEFAKDNAKGVIPKNSVLVTATGVGSAGRAFAQLKTEALIADAHITVMPTASAAAAAYLCAYLQSPVGVQQLMRQRRGSSRQIEIYPEDILSVLVPPLDERTRESIAKQWMAAAAKIDQSLNAVNEAEAEIERHLRLDTADSRVPQGSLGWTTNVSVLRETKRIDPEYDGPDVRYLRAQLLEAGAIPLSNLLIAVGKGVQPSAYVESGVTRVLKSKSVNFPSIDFEDCEHTNDTWEQALRGGEVLINSTGEGTLGRAGFVPNLDHLASPVVPAVDVYILHANSSLVVPEYLALFLSSRIGRQLTTALQTGSSGQQHLYPSHFDFIPVPIFTQKSGRPDLARQREIVAIANQREAAIKLSREVAAQLDSVFLDAVGVEVDLSIVPV